MSRDHSEPGEDVKGQIVPGENGQNESETGEELGKLGERARENAKYAAPLILRRILLNGGKIGEACKEVGVSVETFRLWREALPELDSAVIEAHLKGKGQRHSQVADALFEAAVSGDVQAIRHYDLRHGLVEEKRKVTVEFLPESGHPAATAFEDED